MSSSSLSTLNRESPNAAGIAPASGKELPAQDVKINQHELDPSDVEGKRDPDEEGLIALGLIKLTTAQEVFFIGSLCLGQLVTMAPIGQILAPLRIVGESFNETDVAKLSWFLAAFALTCGTFVLIGGGMGDRYGLKRCFLVSVAWLGLWSFIAGFSVYTKSEVFFDICRAFQGLGSAVVTPNAMGMIGATYPPGPKKGILFCLFGSMSVIGFFATSVFASILAELAWWPWTFWIYSMVTVPILITGSIFIPKCFMRRLSQDGSEPPPFDVIGALTGTSGLILFNVAWNQAPTAGWSTPYVIVCLLLGVILLTAFILVERKAPAPLIPIRELNIGVLLVLMCVMFGLMSFGVFLYYWWQIVEVIQGHSPLGAVARHVPAAVSAVAAAGVVAVLVTRVKSCWLMLGAMVTFVTANILLTTLNPELLYWKQLFWATLIIPFGMDMVLPASSLMMSNLVPKELQGVAAGLIATIANYSIALGLGISGTIEVRYNDGGRDPLAGYKSALYFACGSGGMGLLTAIYIVVREYSKPPPRQARDSKE